MTLILVFLFILLGFATLALVVAVAATIYGIKQAWDSWQELRQIQASRANGGS